MLTVKSLHIIFMVTWFAGLFYLPRLFVYHALTHDRDGNYREGSYHEGSDRFKVMERKLFYGIMTPGALLTLASGLWLWIGWGFNGGWLHAKLLFVAVLIVYHIWCGKLLTDFQKDRNRHSHVWYRWFNEFPVVVLVAVVFLVVMKPF